jgi:small subunit ribosomal protein S4e
LGKKGGSTGLKRKPAPRFWPIHRKEFTWIVKPSPGPHSLQKSIPLSIVLRDILGIAQTGKEAKAIVSKGKILVDGKIRREEDFPVSLMDVITLPDIDKSFRVLPSLKGLILHPIAKEESSFKLCRIEDKVIVKNGHVQLSLNDGSNIFVKVADAKSPQEDIFEVSDTVKISLPERHVIEQEKMKEDNFAIVTGGKNMGRYGRIVEIEKAEAKKRKNAFVIIEDAKGNQYQTVFEFVFAIGETKPLISLPEAV